MALKDRILAYLQTRPDGADDGEIERALGVRYHSQVNSRCRELEAEGIIERRKAGRTLRNFYRASGSPTPTAAAAKVRASAAHTERPWHWEGNVQSDVVAYLVRLGCTIERVADTAAREAGKDVVARRDGRPLWVSVKGYPTGTARTSPSTQARHWFKDAMFDIIDWRGQDAAVGLALALPDFATYRGLAQRVAWLQPIARFTILWVQEDGTVEAQEAAT
jgi:hypothetical protein